MTELETEQMESDEIVAERIGVDDSATEMEQVKPTFNGLWSEQNNRIRLRIPENVKHLAEEVKSQNLSDKEIATRLADLAQRDIQPILDLWLREQKDHLVSITDDIPGYTSVTPESANLRTLVRTIIDQIYSEYFVQLMASLVIDQTSPRAEQIRWLYYKQIIEAIDSHVELVSPQELSDKLNLLNSDPANLMARGSGIENSEIVALIDDVREDFMKVEDSEELNLTSNDIFFIEEILGELMTNACRYADGPEFSIYVTKEKSQFKLTIMIRDHGRSDENALTLDRVPTMLLPGISGGQSLGRGSQVVSGSSDFLEEVTCYEQLVINEKGEDRGTTFVLTIEPKKHTQ